MAILQDVINGTSIAVFLDGEMAALSTSLSWQVEHKVRDTSCREGNSWATFMPGHRQWSASCENMVAFKNSAGDPYSAITGYMALNTMFANYIRNQQRLRIIITTSTLDPGNVKFTGEAYVTGITIDTPNEDSSTFTLSLAGCNDLHQTTTGPNPHQWS